MKCRSRLSLDAVGAVVAAASIFLPGMGELTAKEPPASIAKYFQPPSEFAGKFADYRSPLRFKDGTKCRDASDWEKRRAEILAEWHGIMGKWPEMLENPKLEILEKTKREDFWQYRVRVPIAPGRSELGYLLIPEGKGPFPAVFVPFYEPETSAALGGKPMRDFAYQLTKRGFVSLCIGSPGGDARNPVLSEGAECQPLSYLAYVSANAWQILAGLPEVDENRIGIVGHSYGGKWSMFSACLWDKYACGVWSDGGVAFDETRKSVNYWEPWYLGNEPGAVPKRGLITKENPRGGAYKKLVEGGHDLHELLSLMAPRPFLVSGGSEDFPARWQVLNHVVEVNRLLGVENRVAMTNREKHEPNEESNAVIFEFFEWWLKP